MRANHRRQLQAQKVGGLLDAHHRADVVGRHALHRVRVDSVSARNCVQAADRRQRQHRDEELEAGQHHRKAGQHVAAAGGDRAARAHGVQREALQHAREQPDLVDHQQQDHHKVEHRNDLRRLLPDRVQRHAAQGHQRAEHEPDRGEAEARGAEANRGHAAADVRHSPALHARLARHGRGLRRRCGEQQRQHVHADTHQARRLPVQQPARDVPQQEAEEHRHDDQAHYLRAVLAGGAVDDSLLPCAHSVEETAKEAQPDEQRHALGDGRRREDERVRKQHQHDGLLRPDAVRHAPKDHGAQQLPTKLPTHDEADPIRARDAARAHDSSLQRHADAAGQLYASDSTSNATVGQPAAPAGTAHAVVVAFAPPPRVAQPPSPAARPSR